MSSCDDPKCGDELYSGSGLLGDDIDFRFFSLTSGMSTTVIWNPDGTKEDLESSYFFSSPTAGLGKVVLKKKRSKEK